MARLRDILKVSSVYTILGFLPTASRIFLLPVFLTFLSPEDFALIGLNTLIASLLPMLMTLGLENAFVRFYFDYCRDPKLLKAYLSTILLFVIFTSITIGLLIVPFGEMIFDALFKTKEFTFFPYGITALLSAFFSSIYIVIFSLYRNRQDITNYTWFAGGMFVATTITESLAIIVFKAGPVGVIWTKLITTGVITLYFLFRVLYKNGVYFDIRFIKPSYKYSLPLVPYVVFGLIFTSFDRIMIENDFDLTALAAYNLAMSIAHITDAFMYAIQSATYPLVYSMLKENIQKNSPHVNQVYRFTGLIVLLIIALLIAGTPIGVVNFLNPKYLPAIALLPIILISYSFRYLYIVYAEPLFFFKHTRKLPWLTFIGGSVSIIGNLTLLPLFGLAGAAFTFVLAKLIQLFPTYYWYLKASTLRFHLQYIYSLIVLILLVSMLLFYFSDSMFNRPWLLYCAYSLPLAVLVIYMYGTYCIRSSSLLPQISKIKKYL